MLSVTRDGGSSSSPVLRGGRGGGGRNGSDGNAAAGGDNKSSSNNKFSGLDGAHLPRRSDLVKAGILVREEFQTVRQELRDIGGRVRQKLHPAYGQLMEEAVEEFGTARERRRRQRRDDRREAAGAVNAASSLVVVDEIPSNIGGEGRTTRKKQPLEDAMSHVEVSIGNADDKTNAAGRGADYSPGHKVKKRAKKLRSGIELVLEHEKLAGLDEIADMEIDRVEEMREVQRKEEKAKAAFQTDEGDTSITQRDGFMVLGMHRSGTSMLSGLLVNGMGYNVGKPLIGASFDNPKGFFELRTAVLQNDEFFRKQHVYWGSGVVNYDYQKALKMKESGEVTFEEGKMALDVLNNPSNTPWLQKDPRMCITLKTWLPLLKTEPAVVFTYRHPLEVAMSLEKREDDFDLEHGLRIWIAYNMRAVQNMAGLCRVLSSNEAVLANPLEEVQRISDELTSKCHVPAPPTNITQTIVEKFIDPKLQHNKNKREADMGTHKVLVKHGEGCEVRDYDSQHEVGTMHHERESKMYLKAMKVYCDLKSGDAYKEGYEWPSLQ